MSRLRYNRVQARDYLRSQCEHLGRIIEQCGPLKLKVARDADLFNALASAIIYQQLSGKAAATIHGRFCCLFHHNIPEASQVPALSMETLRSVGLSGNKALAVQDLAKKSLDGTLLPMHRFARLDDQQVIENLCLVRGIGPWTAQMFLMFNLGRPDVMPATDLGVQKGVQAVYHMPDLPSPEQVLQQTLHLAPYRSAASWYFWLVADTKLMT